MPRFLATLAALLVLAPAAAKAQPAAPTPEARQAAGRELSLPTGVGGCVFRAVPLDVQKRILEAIMSRRGVPAELPPAVAQVASRCTGRPYSSSDGGLVTASLGAFERTGLAIYFASELAIGQRRLDDAWRAATPAEKAPFLKGAASLMDPKAPGYGPSPAETQPLARRLGIDTDDAKRLSPIQLYYLATAYAEAGEAKLAGEGAKPQPGG